MSRRRDWLLGASALVGATLSAPSMAQPAATGSGPRPRLALALGGGSARGFAHIGVIKALEQAGIRADIVVGTSAGALVGAFLAAGWSAAAMEEFALQVREADVADFASAGRRGMLAGEALARIVGERLRGAHIEQLKLRYAALATDLRSGEAVVIQQGPVADAVRASCSIPGVFVPKEVSGRELVDGGLVSPLPVRTARQLGGEVVLAVDVAARPRRSDFSGLYEVILQSFEIMGRALADQEALQADLVLRPDTARYASSDFGVRREMIQAGHDAAQALMPELRRRLDTAAVRRTPRPPTR
jgi:NTE family protein